MISLYLEMFFVHIDPYPRTSHIMCCAFFKKFQDNTSRNKVEMIVKTQKVYPLIKQKVCLLIIAKY